MDAAVLFNDISDDVAGRDDRIEVSEDDVDVVDVVDVVDFISFLRCTLSVLLSVV